MWGSNGVKCGSCMGVLGWCRPYRAKWGIFWVNRLPPDVWGKELTVWPTDIIGFSGERWHFLAWGMVAFGFCINMVPINGWDTNNVWHIYGWGRNPHARNDVKRIMWSKLYNTRVDHVQLLLQYGVSSMRGWIQYWFQELLHWTHGILMECYIFMTDGLLDRNGT